MNKSFTLLLISFCILTMAFKPPKNNALKGDILYTKYGGNIEKMLEGERIKDSLARPYLYENKQLTPITNEEALPYDDESQIFDRAEIMPKFQNGQDGLSEYIASVLTYLPDTLVGKKTDVLVKFFVNTLGDARNPTILKTDNKSFDLHAIMLINDMPKWTPAKQNGKDVNCYYTLKIQYGK